MELGNIIFLAVVLVLGLVVLLRSHARKAPSDAAKQVFPVWAVQGPFNSGTDSAAAMRNAWLAVFGAEQAGKMAVSIEQHRLAYENDPAGWEKTRREAAESAHADARTLGEGIAAAERINKMLEQGGRRIEFTKLPDGSTQALYNKIWSDEEIERKDKEADDEIVLAIGNGLINDSSKEAQQLMDFLTQVYLSDTGEQPDARAIGMTWLALRARDKGSDSPLAREFERLYGAHSATLLRNLEWSQNPGCFERHLKRKQNNLLFPEEDRTITQEQIDEARERDRDDAAELENEVVDLASVLKKLPQFVTGDHIAPIRERIDELLHRAAGIGGQADNSRDSLMRIRDALIESMREGFRGDEAALKALDDAEEYYHSTVGIAHDPFITQISRIPSTDVIPAMLGESSEIIRKTMSIIGQDKVELVFKEACDLIERVLAEGEVIPLADEKLKAIKGG